MKKLTTLMAMLLATTAWAEQNSKTEERELALDSIVVTGTLTEKRLMDTPILTKVITAKDIEMADATNIQDLLTKEMPGVEFTYAMNQMTHMNFSGFGGQSVLFLVDGERLSGETMDDVDFTRLNMANVERIEIIKGAVSALYGSNANGGVINIITKTPVRKWALNVNGRMGIHEKRAESRYGGLFALNGKYIKNSLSYVGTNTDGYEVRNGQNPQTINIIHRFFGDRNYNVSDKLTWTPMKNLKFTARASYFVRDKQTPTVTEPDRYRDFNGGLRGVWNITANDVLEVAYGYDQYDKAKIYTLTNKQIRNYSNTQHSAKAIYSHTFGKTGTLTTGADFMHDYLMNTKTKNGVYEQNCFDAFAQFDWDISDRWELVTALRYDNFSDGNISRLTPKVNARYKASDNVVLRAGYGMGFRAPTLKEKYYIFNIVGIWDIVGSNIAGNELKPEQSHNFNLSAEWNKNGYVVTGTAYCNLIKDRITTGVPMPESVFPGDKSLLGADRWLSYINIDHYNSFGFDLTVQKRWSNGLGARISYAYVNEQLPKDKDGEAINNQYLPARPHSLTARLDWDKQVVKNYGVNIALTGQYYSATENVEYVDYSTIDPNTGKLLKKNMHYVPYTMWNLRITQRFYKAVRFTFTLDNLFNYKPEYYYMNAPSTDGINVLMGLAIDVDKFFKSTN